MSRFVAIVRDRGRVRRRRKRTRFVGACAPMRLMRITEQVALRAACGGASEDEIAPFCRRHVHGHCVRSERRDRDGRRRRCPGTPHTNPLGGGGCRDRRGVVGWGCRRRSRRRIRLRIRDRSRLHEFDAGGVLRIDRRWAWGCVLRSGDADGGPLSAWFGDSMCGPGFLECIDQVVVNLLKEALDESIDDLLEVLPDLGLCFADEAVGVHRGRPFVRAPRRRVDSSLNEATR